MSGPRREGLRILLVEDHDDTLRTMSRLLRSRGHQVTGVSSVQEAREVSSRERFDLLISDIGLPDGSGFEVLRHLRTTQPVRGIALSGFGRAEDLWNSRKAGFDHHLTKPVDFQSLEELIREMSP